MRRTIVFSLGPVVATTAIAAAQAAAPDVALRELGDHWTEGHVVVDAPPSELYALATDYATWQQRFSDIERVAVERGGRDDARVRFRSRAFDDHTVTVQFQNTPDRLIAFRGVEGPPGGRARGEYRLTPVDGGRRTEVTARLYMHVVGVPGLLVRDATERGYRQAKLRSDLGDMQRAFSRR